MSDNYEDIMDVDENENEEVEFADSSETQFAEKEAEKIGWLQKIAEAAVSGLFIAAAVVGHTFYVFGRNLIFGEHHHLNFAKAVQTAKGQINLNNEAEKLKKEGKENPNAESSRTERDHGKEEQDKKKEQEQNGIRFTKEHRKEMYEVLKDPNSCNDYINTILNSQEIQQIFGEIGIHPVNMENGKKIYLFSEHTAMDMDKISFMHKADFLFGKAEELASAIYHYADPKTEEKRMESVFSAMLAQAKINDMIFESEYNKLADKDGITLATSDFITKDHYAEDIVLTAGTKEKTFNLEIGGKQIQTFSLEKPIGETVAEISKAFEAYHEKEKQITHTINDITFQKTGAESVRVSIGTQEHCFAIHEENDLKQIKTFLMEAGMEEKTAEANAMVIGTATNPIIEKSLDEFGFETNPFTGNKLETGDLYINNKNMPPKIEVYKIDIVNGKFRENNDFLADIDDYNDGKNYEKTVDRITEQLNVEKPENALDDLVQPKPTVGYRNMYENPLCSNGEKAYKTLQERCVLSGEDASRFQFKVKEGERSNEKRDKSRDRNQKSYKHEKTEPKPETRDQKSTKHEESQSKSECRDQKPSPVYAQEPVQEVAFSSEDIDIDDDLKFGGFTHEDFNADLEEAYNTMEKEGIIHDDEFER